MGTYARSMPLTASKTAAWTIAPRRLPEGGGTFARAKVVSMMSFQDTTTLSAAARAVRTEPGETRTVVIAKTAARAPSRTFIFMAGMDIRGPVLSLLRTCYLLL